MGALHEGHLSLARLCGPCDVRVMSIFVNPTQFGSTEDFARYPRDLESDAALCDQEGLDFVYAPTVDEMYGVQAKIEIDPGAMGKIWEGMIRPDHFRGVLTVVGKLLHQVRPDSAVFGEKDFQQLVLLRAMCKSLDWPVTILAGKTLREADGLAMSSRNRFLKKSERELAPVLFRALTAGQDVLRKGERELKCVQDVMRDVVRDAADMTVDYLTAVHSETMAETSTIPENGRLIGAIRLGSVRLIDNLPTNDANPELSTA